jgi:hypothetical protein
MALRTGHGAGRGSPRVEVLPPDELPTPVAASRADDGGPLHRRQDGKIADSDTAKAMGKRGGEAKARRVRLVDSLGLATIASDSSFGPYRTAAEEFVKAHLSSLATQAGGEVGTGPSTMVASAGLQLAASRWAFDRAAELGDPALMKLGSALANDSRQNLLAAYELATREAQAKPRRPGDPVAAMKARLLGPQS